MNLDQQLTTIQAIAREAGQIALQYFGKVERLTKTHAATTDEAVTVADRLTQAAIVKQLRQHFPTDGIIGEEDDSGSGITFDVKDPNGRVWVIDPIDGTNNFVAGFGAWCVCIGLLEKGTPVLGLVYDVTRNLMYSGIVGRGATLNDQQMTVNDVPFSSKSVLMLTANVLTPDKRLPGWMAKFVGQTEWKVRIIGSAALEAASVASGVASAAVTVNGKLWDCVAPAAVLLAAGGVITTLQGEAIFPFNLQGYTGAKVPFVAATPKSQPQILKAIADHP
jgi:myo-inositol-1(or 4)-monophosphatase